MTPQFPGQGQQSPCPAWQNLLVRRTDDLTEAEQAQLRHHLRTCAACRRAYKDYTVLIRGLRALPSLRTEHLGVSSLQATRGSAPDHAPVHGEVPPVPAPLVSDQARQPTRRKTLLAGALVACLILAALWLFTGHPQPGLPASQPGTVVLSYTHHNSASAVSWSPDGTRLASAGEDGFIQIWDLTTHQRIANWKTPASQIYSLAWSPNGTELLWAGGGGRVQIWAVQTGQTLFQTTGPVGSIAWSPDSTQIALGWDTTVQIWEARQGASQPLAVLQGSGIIASVAWSPNGQLIAAGDQSHLLLVWDAQTHQLVHTFPQVQNAVLAVAWSPDSKDLAAANGSEVQVWDMETLGLLSTYTGHHNTVQALAWSPDGVWIASASWDATVQVWDAHTAHQILLYHGHHDRVIAVAWSPNGAWIASASWDTSIQVWIAP